MKKVLTKLLAVCLMVAMLVTLAGCGGDQLYELDGGLTIYMESGFQEMSITENIKRYQNNNVTFEALREPYENFVGIETNTFTAFNYAQKVIEENQFNAEPKMEDGLACFEYTNGGFYTFASCFKSGKEYWCCMFTCEEGLKDSYRDKFVSWSKTIIIL